MKLSFLTVRSRRRVTNKFKDILILILATAVTALVLWNPHHHYKKVLINHYQYQPSFTNNHNKADGKLKISSDQTFFHTYPDNNRYISGDTWRPPLSFGSHIFKLHEESNEEIQLGNLGLQQPIPFDHSINSDRLLLLLKTGSKTIWQRLPVHLFTTLTGFPNFALYSDSADSIAGYEVIDILANVSQSLLLENKQFASYRRNRQLRAKHNYLRPDEIDDVHDGWGLDKFKNIRMFYHAYKQAPDMDWYVMIDDDTIILPDNLCKFLSSLDPQKEYYLGSAVAGLEYIFAHGGSGIVLSQGAVRKAFGHAYSEEWVEQYTLRAESECCGDYMVAMYLKETSDILLDYQTSAGRFQGEPIWAVPCSSNNWCQELITLHHQRPADFELMWEYQKIRKLLGTNNPILYSDIYTDFEKPYFPKDPQKNWDNGAKDVEISWAKEVTTAAKGENLIPPLDADSNKPYGSLQSCRRECETKADCIMYRYDPYMKYCGLSSSTIALGRPVLRYDDAGFSELCNELGVELKPRDINDESHQMISGWYLDRIIAMRKGQSCDRLYKNPHADGKVNGVKDQVEGWFIRAKTRYPDSYPDPLKHI